jgi:hypothetical protein
MDVPSCLQKSKSECKSTMSSRKTTYDVFVSHGLSDRWLVGQILQKLQFHKLRAFVDIDVPSGRSFEKALWEAMSESQALIVAIPTNTTGQMDGIAFELGAARAWDKPVYAISSDPGTAKLPGALARTQVFSLAQLDEICEEIRQSLASLTEQEKRIAIEEYFNIDMPLDQLMLQPQLLSKLTQQFRKKAKRQVSSEELLRTLLRIRKTGNLRRPNKEF